MAVTESCFTNCSAINETSCQFILAETNHIQVDILAEDMFAYSKDFFAQLYTTISNAVKPMNNTQDIGLFFFFIHILLGTD